MKSITSLVLLMSSFSITAAQPEQIQIRIHGDAALPTLIYLPGLHGDWTLMSSFRVAVESKVRFVEFTYPRTLEWSLENYAEAVEKALAQNGITHGWLLGESFSSQVAWTMVGRTQKTTSQFCIDGIILSAGFVKHPNRLGVAFAEKFSGRLPRPCFDAFLSVYATYGKFRHRHAPETLTNLHKFIARRTELDRQAITHRIGLVYESDPRSIARQTAIPVHALAGFWDPVVPRTPVKRWLKKNCPAYREGKTIFNADHNVLGTAPEAASETILAWMGIKKS